MILKNFYNTNFIKNLMIHCQNFILNKNKKFLYKIENLRIKLKKINTSEKYVS